VNKSARKHLKIYTEKPPEGFDPRLGAMKPLRRLCRALRKLTGWKISYVPEERRPGGQPAGSALSERRSGGSRPTRWSAPVSPGDGTTLGHLRLDPPKSARDAEAKPADARTVRELAESVAGLLGELAQARRALWLREAELAAAVPVVPHPCEQAHLAERLESVLRAGAEAVDCQAAALYVLDEATTQLKLRSCWGLSPERLEAPARPLRGAMADLEALLGHAVVLNDPELLQMWRVPEDYPAAVCLPVSSPTTLLGTLWFFAAGRRDFTERQLGILETVAGRVAAELEREVLLSEAWQFHRLKGQLAAAERLHRNQRPVLPPLSDQWQLGGRVFGWEGFGGAVFDWFTLPDGLLAFVVARTRGEGLEAAFSSATLRSALRAHARYHREPQPWLGQTNMTMWTGSAGDFRAEAVCGLAETATGRIALAGAGPVVGWRLGTKGMEPVKTEGPLLGAGAESSFGSCGLHLAAGERLVLIAGMELVCRASSPEGQLASQLVRKLASCGSVSAEGLAAAAAEWLSEKIEAPENSQGAVLVIQRSG